MARIPRFRSRRMSYAKKTRSNTVKKAVRKVRRTNFNRKVKAVIASLKEDKQAFTTTGNSLLKFNSGIDSVGDLVQILPGISQGVAENQRIGNQICAKNLNVRGYLKLDVNDVSDSTKLPNVVARMMVVSMKTAGCFTDAQSQSPKVASLLKKGGTTTTFAGNLQDIYAPINRDVFTVHYDKKFYLRQDFINAVGASPPSTTISQDVSKTVKFFNLNVKCKNKILKYDEDVGSDILPSNFAPFILLGYSYLDGSAPDVLDTKLGLCYDAVLTYEDA